MVVRGYVFLRFFFSSRRRHTRLVSDWSSDVCSSDLHHPDHAGLASWLTERTGAEFWMPQAEYFAAHAMREGSAGFGFDNVMAMFVRNRSEERRVGKECRSRWSPYH